MQNDTEQNSRSNVTPVSVGEGDGGLLPSERNNATTHNGRGPFLPKIRLSGPPKRGSATDMVTDALREAILDGAIAQGTWLLEDELARDLSVSRTPVREALRALADEHLVDRVPNRGSVVAPMTFEEVLAVYFVREPLEGLAARIVATTRPPALLGDLDRVVSQMSKACDRDKIAFSKLNREFHQLQRDASGNPYLIRFLVQVEHAVRRLGTSTFDVPGRMSATVQEHQAVVEAIGSGDGEAAAEAASLHVRRAREARMLLVAGG